MVKSSGHRVSSCSAPSFHCRKDEIAEELRPALWPLFDQLAAITKQIRAYDRAIEKLCEVALIGWGAVVGLLSGRVLSRPPD